MSKLSHEDKFNLAQGFIERAGQHFKEKLGSEGPDDSKKKGMGFVKTSTDSPLGSGDHPVEFRKGASNVEAIEAEEREKK